MPEGVLCPQASATTFPLPAQKVLDPPPVPVVLLAAPPVPVVVPVVPCVLLVPVPPAVVPQAKRRARGRRWRSARGCAR
jgi:hypothetical protein